MGTRADFFIGRGDNARSLGSVPHDGYIASDGKAPFGVPAKVLEAKSEEEFESRVEEFFKDREKVCTEKYGSIDDIGPIIIRPNEPWPWPWHEFELSDYSYAFDEGKVWCCRMFYDWYDPLNEERCEEQRRDIYGHTRFKYGVKERRLSK